MASDRRSILIALAFGAFATVSLVEPFLGQAEAEDTVALFKIVTTLVVAMSVVPLLFLTAKGGDKAEPKDIFDTD